MKRKFMKWQSLVLAIAMLVTVMVPAFGVTASAAATHAIDICTEDGTSVTEQITLMESEQLQLTHKLLDCSMPEGGYITWTSESPLIVSVDSTGKIYAHDSSKGAAVRLWIDNDVRTVAVIGPVLAKTMEKLLFNDNIDLDTMDTEAILNTVRASMNGIPSNISDYLIKQLEDKLNSLDTGITVTLYSADGEVLASDQVRVLVTNSDKWYASLIPNGAFITNKESLPTTVAVGGTVKLEGGVTPLRLGYGVTWSIDTDSIWTSGKDYATIDDRGNVSFLKEGKVTIKVSPNADDLVDGLMSYINSAIGAGKSVDTAQLARIMIKLLGLNVSEKALKAVLDVLVTVAGSTGNTADLIATAVKTLSNYLLKASINDSITFTIVQSLEIEKFSLTADKTELTEGDSTMVRLTDIVPAGSNSQNVLWSSSDESVLTVDSNGIVKARDAGGISSANKRTATVTATVDGVSESLEFTVKGKLITTPVDISISGPQTLELDTPQQYTAVLYPERSKADITWGLLGDDGETISYASKDSVSNSIATLTKDGVLTASNGGTVTLYAKSGLISPIVSKYEIYVGKLAHGVEIDQGDYVSVHVPLYSTYKNAKTTLTASILPYDVTNKNVAWSVLSGNIEVSPEGVVSPKGYSAAYGVVQVKTYDGGYTDTCTVSFANYPVTGITLDKDNLNLTVGTNDTISATVAPTGTVGVGDASIKDIIWTSSNPTVARVENGTVIPVDFGTTIIKATTVDGGFAASCTVNVKADKTALNYAVNLVENGSLTEKDCTPEDWAELQEAYKTALEVKNTDIVSQSTCDRAAQNIIDIYSRIGAYVQVYGITITLDGETAPKFISKKVEFYQSYKNKTVQLGAVINPTDAMYSSIVWSSDNDKVTVDQNGLVTNTHNSADSAKITVRATDYTGCTVSDSVYVSFANVPATGVTLNESEITGKVYNSAKLTATVTPKGTPGIGASIENVIWSSSNPDVVSVDNGNLTFNSVGTAKITVTTVDGGHTVECSVTVTTNKDALAAAISKVTNAELVEEDYTVASYDALKEAYARANEVYNDESAAQSDIDSVTTAVESAFASLKKLIKPEAVFIQYGGEDADEYISKEVNLSTSFTYQNNSIKLDTRISPLDSMYKTVEWTSSTDLISVDESGNVSPTENKACYGVITLKVTDERGNTVTDSVNVSFARYPVTKVEITPSEVNAPFESEPVKLTAKCTDVGKVITYDATIQDIIWTSDNPSAVTVDENGQLTYVDAGQATITATSCDGGITATCLVTVGGDKTALRAAIQRADDANIDIQEYTYETSTEYTAAYDRAKEVEAGAKYSQEEIDAATLRLNTALDSLKPYIHMQNLNIYYNGETAPQFIAIKVPIYKTYTSQSVQLTYDFAPADAMYSSIVWSSDNDGLKVTEDGKVSPASNKACGGKITLTATDHYGNTVTNSVYVSFANDPVSKVTLDKTEIEVVYGSEPQTLTATVTADKTIGDKPSVSDVVWTTSDPDVATVDNGTVTFVEAGTCTITVMSVDGGVSATCTVTVRSDKTELIKTRAMMVGLNLQAEDYTDESWAVFAAAMEKADEVIKQDNPKQRIVNAANEELNNAYNSLVRYIKLEEVVITKDGETAGDHISVSVPITSKYSDMSVTLGYKLVPEDALIDSVVWESSDSSVKVEDGVVSPAGNKACYAVITVKATDYRGNVFTDSVYVSFANTPVTGISVDKTEITNAVVGSTDKITATVLPKKTLGVGGASITDVIWESSDPTVATVENGTLSFKNTGTCTITVTTVDGGFSAETSVKVYADKSALGSAIDSANALAEISYTPATWAEMKTALASATEIFNAEDPDQAEVDEALKLLNEKVEALQKYVYVKNVNISYNGDSSDVITITVPEDQSYIMATAQLDFNTDPANAMYVSAEWSYEGDVFVNMNGIAAPSKNSACYGKATVKLTDDFGNEYTKTVTIIFAKNPATAIAVTPSEYTTHTLGEQVQLAASVTGADGNSSDLNEVVWKSSNDSIATVDGNGLVTIISGGVVTITATTVIGGLSAKCVITVATDKTALKKAIDDAEGAGYIEQNYTKDSYAAYLAALSKAKDVYANDDASQSEIDTAATELVSAAAALVAYNRAAKITIKQNGSDAAKFISVKVPVYKTYTSQSVQLSYEYSPSDAMFESIVWSSDNDLVTVDQNGKVVPKENKACAAKITVTITDHFGNSISDYVYVAFANIPATGISLNESSLSGKPGETASLTASIEPKAKLGVGGANITDVIWTTSDPSVATVENGTVTFVDGGTAVITAYTMDGGHSAQCTVTVTVAKDELLSAINAAKAIDLSVRTEATANALRTAITEAESVYNNSSAKSEDIANAITALKNATDALEYLAGNYDKVNAAVAAFNKLNAAKYTEESYNAVKAAVNAVDYSLNITKQSEIDAMADRINDAIGNLVKVVTAKVKAVRGGVTIDEEKLFIYGIEPHTDSLESYLAAENGTLKIVATAHGQGTGTKIELYDEDGVLVKTYTLVIFGDLNGDGWYDATDATIVNCIVGGMFTKDQLGEAVWLAADCNHDGVIGEEDSEMLQQAGVLLQQIDQGAKQTELETSSVYNEYIGLIDQNIESEKPDKNPAQQNWVITIFEQIFNLIKLLLAILK